MPCAHPAGTHCHVCSHLMLVFLLGSLLLTSRGEEVKVGADGSSSATFSRCLESYEDEKALECLTSRSPASVVSETDLSGGLSHAMTRGLWKSASHILAIAKGRNLDLVNVVGNTAAGIRRELEAVTASVVHKTEGIIPAYEWAQSVEQVFLQVKWAHKLDAPATLGCVPSQPTFSPTSVSFKAECKDKGKTFLLQLPLFGPIVANNCTWANASVGRAIITLQKLQDGPWPRLLVDAKKPANQGTWFAMRENHIERLDAWTKPTPTPVPTASPAAPEAPTEAPPTEVPLPPLGSLGGVK